MARKRKQAELPQNPNFLVVIRSIVVDSNEKILLLKRSKSHVYYPEKWELPGGRIIADRDPWVSLSEIIDRETNVIIGSVSTRFYTHSRLVTEPGKYQGYIYIELTAESMLVGGDVKIAKSEHTEFKWVDPNEVFNYDLTLESKKALAQHFLDQKREEAANKVHLVSRALVRNDQNKILLLKRNKQVTFSNAWELPGGKLSSLETLSMVLRREVFEETGLSIDIVNEVIHFGSSIEKEGKYKGKTFINIISEATIKAGNLRLSSEHADFGWFTEKEVTKLSLAPYLELPIVELFLGKGD